jgi:predicted transcriptional regulator
MSFSDPQKNKINLFDYDYLEDIKNRILMSNLSLFEVEVLIELVNGSLKNSIEHLSDALEASKETTQLALVKLEPSKLFSIQGSSIIINKAVRKYYEAQIEKFDDDFKPNIEFLQTILNKVPIEVLPGWYSLPKNSNNIFSSIIDKFLITPKVYSTYLSQLEFDSPIFNSIIQDLYNSPDLKLSSSVLLKRYALSRAQLEEYFLHLEYNFVCCVSYSKKGDGWEEVLTPFYEWRQYCLLQKKSTPNPIQDDKNVHKLSTNPKKNICHSLVNSELYTPKNIREIERSLKNSSLSGWIYIDDFLNGFTSPINNKETATLRNKGKRWEYQLPSYSKEELEFIQAVITEKFFETGLTAIGVHKKRLCFSLTPFGKKSITNQ